MSTNDPKPNKLSLSNAAAVIGIITGCVGLLFLLWPSLKPDEPPAEMGAALSNVKLEYNVTFEDYLLAHGATWKLYPGDYSFEALGEKGNVVSFTATIKGFKGSTCSLQWSIFNADTQSRVPGLAGQNWGTLKPEAAVDTISEAIWVDYPPSAGNYFVRLTILDDNGVSIATGDSEVFNMK